MSSDQSSSIDIYTEARPCDDFECSDYSIIPIERCSTSVTHGSSSSLCDIGVGDGQWMQYLNEDEFCWFIFFYHILCFSCLLFILYSRYSTIGFFYHLKTPRVRLLVSYLLVHIDIYTQPRCCFTARAICICVFFYVTLQKPNSPFDWGKGGKGKMSIL